MRVALVRLVLAAAICVTATPLNAQVVVNPSFVTGLGEGTGIILDGSKNLYVVNTLAGSIYVFPSVQGPNGLVVHGGAAGSSTLFASGLIRPVGLALDNAQNLYVTDYIGNFIVKYASANGPNGPVVSAATPSAFATSTTVPSLSAPYGLAVDNAQNLYVANAFGRTVTKFASASGPNGPVVSAASPSTFATGLVVPVGLLLDNAQNLYVSNFGSTITKFAAVNGVPGSAGATFASCNPAGSQCALLNMPAGMVLDGAQNLYVMNFNGGNISKFPSVNGAVSGTAGAAWVSTPSPSYGVTDGQGNLYVTNDVAGTVTKISGLVAFSTPIAAVPTLGVWAMIGLAALLAGAAIIGLRARSLNVN